MADMSSRWKTIAVITGVGALLGGLALVSRIFAGKVKARLKA